MVGVKSCRAESATRAGKVKTRLNVTHDFNGAVHPRLQLTTSASRFIQQGFRWQKLSLLRSAASNWPHRHAAACYRPSSSSRLSSLPSPPCPHATKPDKYASPFEHPPIDDTYLSRIIALAYSAFQEGSGPIAVIRVAS
jgi:hypothetical protein